MEWKGFNMVSKKILVIAASVLLVLGGISSFTKEHWNDASLSSDSKSWTEWKTEWKTIEDDYEKISIAPGSDETQLNFAWYSHTAETPKVRYGTARNNMETEKTYVGKQESTTIAYSAGLQETLGDAEGTYYSNKVTVEGLKKSTKYYYQIFQNGNWSEIKSFDTKDFKNYSVLYFTDPQIGSCKSQINSEEEAMSGSAAARNDSYNWNQIISNAVEYHDISFLISAGDQVDDSSKEYEYAGFLSPTVMASLPLASTIGNHDTASQSYTWHFNNPNSFDVNNEENASYVEGYSEAGTDYYYRYGDALFIVLDTNNDNCKTHENVIAKAVKENSDCKWRIVTMHHDIYGSGADHSDSDGMKLRTQLTPMMDQYEIDVVLQGHDHTYSRTYQITSDGQQHTAYDSSNYLSDAEYLNQNNCYNICSTAEDGNQLINPEGTVYFEQNSATGSKYYGLIKEQQDYISERSQNWTPSYSIIEVTSSTLTVTAYNGLTNDVLEGSSPYTIVKED